MLKNQGARRYDFILLDADNTLFDFDLAEKLALDITLSAFGYPITENYTGAYHRSNRALWSAFEAGEISQDAILAGRFQGFLDAVGGREDSLEMNRFYMDTLATQDQLYQGAEDFCRRLSRDYTLAIVTNGVSPVQHGRMDKSPIRPYFSAMFVSADVGFRKPQPEIFDAVCKALSITDRSRAVMMGDSLSSDILGGNLAGIDTIWYNPKGLSQRGGIFPTYTVSSFEEALKLLGATPY